VGCGVGCGGVLQQFNGGIACFFFDLPLPPDAFFFSLLLPLLLPFNFVLREHGGVYNSAANCKGTTRLRKCVIHHAVEEIQTKSLK